MLLIPGRLTAIAGYMICLFMGYACTPNPTQESIPTSIPTFTETIAPLSTLALSKTETPTPLPVTPVVSATVSASSCQLVIRGSYNFPRKIVERFSMGPGRHIFYDAPGGGKYGNDQAGCELNEDCTQLRAFNKDSADLNPEGRVGFWVDSQTGLSLARWNQYVVLCRLADPK